MDLNSLSSPQPKPRGKVHPSLQLVESPVEDISSLRSYLGRDDPFRNWLQEDRADGVGEVDARHLSSWFSNQDDRIAFYTPVSSPASYDRLTYRQLHQQIQKCPSFVSNRPAVVAILLPAEQMAEMAVVLLSVMAQDGAVAVPLDPRMPTGRMLDSLQQLNCTSLVTTEEFLLQSNLLDKHYPTRANTYQSRPVAGNASPFSLEQLVQDIRLVESDGGCGRLHWTVLESKQNKSKQEYAIWTEKVPETTTTFINISDPNAPAMLLRTSGTTSTPKVVPISRSMLLYGAISIAAALKLQSNDVNANSMPFYHIGGISCNLLAVLVSGGSVLLAGPLNDPNAFLDHLTSKALKATWYYAGPSMHKAILLMAEARLAQNKQNTLSTHLRFVRSASAHLNHDLALRLSTVFQCQVIPTYGMSEAMPVCSSAPIDIRHDPPCQVIDSVGYPTGTSLCILDPNDKGSVSVLPYGEDQVGEIAVKGAGVIKHYIGLDVATTHTHNGWLRTGDHGILDQQGRLFIKGRSKEMIKRGGEQVWPNEIDDVVEKVPGIATAVSFGVPNELWGEEVAVAVVLRDSSRIQDSSYLKELEHRIMEMCRQKLDELSMPQQFRFLSSTNDLVKGSTGKYIRSQMANHLGITAVDTGALRVLESVRQFSSLEIVADTASDAAAGGRRGDNEKDVPALTFKQWLNKTSESTRRVVPSEALNGVRFLVACFVVQVHVGRFPTLGWIKFQGYMPNMMIFFALASFQISCSVTRSVRGQWASFVGTKIGSLHALFFISNVFTLPSYILFHCFDESGNLAWTIKDWIATMAWFTFDTLTGFAHGYSVSNFTWFQSTLYSYLILFPFLDDFFRKQTMKIQGILLIVSIVVAASLWGIMYLFIPSEIFWGPVYPIGWSIVAWLPLLIAGMLSASFFREFVEWYLRKWKKTKVFSEEEECFSGKRNEDPDTILVEWVADYSKVWGYICDVCSLLLFAAAVVVVTAPSCLCVYDDTFKAMRPGEELPNESCGVMSDKSNYVWTCGITRHEFVDYIQIDPHHDEYGRFGALFSGAFGYMRTSAPLFLLWVVSMGFGNGYTARLFSSKFMTQLAPLGYAVYLLHMSVARYYVLLTRGIHPQPWWEDAGEFPFLVEWYDFIAILFITIAVGYTINTYVVPPLLPYTISIGVSICSAVSLFVRRCLNWCGCSSKDTDVKGEDSETSDLDDSSSEERLGGCNIKDFHSGNLVTYAQVKKMVRGLTGMDVNRTMKLRYLGLDSLGSAALLGMLRASVPAAKNLSLDDLQQCETVGCLADFLDRRSFSSSPISSTSSLPNKDYEEMV